MLRRSPLKAKRDAPRRNEGRVKHGRIKPKATGQSAEEARFIELVAGLGCLICGKLANVHHIMHAPGKLKRRDHRFIAPLCRDHHQGDDGVHGLGSEGAFRDLWGVDIVGWAMAAWHYRDAPDAPFWTDSILRLQGIARARLLKHKVGRGTRDEARSTRPDPIA